MCIFWPPGPRDPPPGGLRTPSQDPPGGGTTEEGPRDPEFRAKTTWSPGEPAVLPGDLPGQGARSTDWVTDWVTASEIREVTG